jgi:hypothetical protein
MNGLLGSFFRRPLTFVAAALIIWLCILAPLLRAISRIFWWMSP